MHGVVILESGQMLGSLVELWVETQPDLRLVSRCTSRDQALDPVAAWVDDVGLLLCGTTSGPDDAVTLATDMASRAGRPLPVVAITGVVTPADVTRMGESFGAGWALLSPESNGPLQLRRAVDVVLAGGVMVDPAAVREKPGRGEPANLSPQELAVLEGLARGLSNHAIAQQQFVSVKSVERLVGMVYAKLGLDGSAKDTNPRVLAALRYRTLHPE